MRKTKEVHQHTNNSQHMCHFIETLTLMQLAACASKNISPT